MASTDAVYKRWSSRVFRGRAHILDVSSASHVCKIELRFLKDFSETFAIRNRIFPIKAQGINHLECSSNNCCCNPKVIFSVTGTGHSMPAETHSMSHEVKVEFAHWV